MTARATTLGTPTSGKWTGDWLAEVDRTEQQLGRRICGAHNPAFKPCTLASTHPCGRCRFHGGADGIGAPNGNRNAWVHGLYSRRLQQCGDHCPLWKHCPMAGNDVLDLPAPERPHCVYEQDEYDALLAGMADQGGLGFQPERRAGQSSESSSEHLLPISENAIDKLGLEAQATEDPLRAPASPREPNVDQRNVTRDPVIARSEATKQSLEPAVATLIQRNVALFQVMLSRAQAALRIASLTDETRAYTGTYQRRSVRVSALVQAQLHIARELRQWLKLLPGFDPRPKPARAEKPPKPEPPKGLPGLMKPLLEEAEVVCDELLGPGGFPGRVPPPTPA
jgi:hypothetical protein